MTNEEVSQCLEEVGHMYAHSDDSLQDYALWTIIELLVDIRAEVRDTASPGDSSSERE